MRSRKIVPLVESMTTQEFAMALKNIKTLIILGGGGLGRVLRQRAEGRGEKYFGTDRTDLIQMRKSEQTTAQH